MASSGFFIGWVVLDHMDKFVPHQAFVSNSRTVHRRATALVISVSNQRPHVNPSA